MRSAIETAMATRRARRKTRGGIREAMAESGYSAEDPVSPGLGYRLSMIQGPLPRREAILELLNSQTRALHAREIAARLHVEEAAYPSFLRVLTDLATTGVIRPHAGQRFRSNAGAGAGQGTERQGVLSVNPRGFG